MLLCSPTGEGDIKVPLRCRKVDGSQADGKRVVLTWGGREGCQGRVIVINHCEMGHDDVVVESVQGHVGEHPHEESHPYY